MVAISNQLLLAQCSVEKSQIDGSTVYTHAPEEVYSENRDGNGLYADGAYSAYVSTTASFVKEEVLMVLINVQVISVDTKQIVLRSMRFNFQNSTPMTIEADTYDKRWSGDGVVYRSQFDVSRKDILNRIAKNNIDSVSIIDSRNNQSISSNPYPKILRNQVGCVLERI